MPVTLPPVTIMRCDSSLIFRPCGRALELRHQVEARQGGLEVGLQVLPHEILDAIRAAQHAQPQPHRTVMIIVDAGLGVDGAAR